MKRKLALSAVLLTLAFAAVGFIIAQRSTHVDVAAAAEPDVRAFQEVHAVPPTVAQPEAAVITVASDTQVAAPDSLSTEWVTIPGTGIAIWPRPRG